MDYNCIVQENVSKKITLNDLPPTSNFNNKSEFNKAEHSTIESVSQNINEINAFRIFNNKFHKKSPINFISQKDWQKYIKFTNSIVNYSECKTASSTQKGKTGQIFRLLHSFQKLYEEYSHVFDDEFEPVQNSGDTVLSPPFSCDSIGSATVSFGTQCEEKSNTLHTFQVFNNVEVQTIITMKQIKVCMPSTKSPNELINDNAENASTLSYSFIPWKMRNLINPAKRFGKKIKQITNNNVKNHLSIGDSKFFDKIIKIDSNIVIDVVEEVHQQMRVIHCLSLVSMNQEKFNLPKMKFLQIPLAIELLLPKIQKKIEYILKCCPFLYDPLEVAAELRHFGYNEVACERYFKMTKGFRSIIEEMMPTDNLNELYNPDQFRMTRTSSFLSTNSPMISINQIDPFNDSTKTSDSNANTIILNKNLRNSRMSIDSNNPSPNDSVVFPEEMKRNLSIINNIYPTDCITQTNLFDFYTGDDDMDTLFYEIKQYIATMRNLQVETRSEIDHLRKQLCCVFTSLKGHIALFVNQTNEKSFSDDQKNKMSTLSKQVEELKLKLKKEEKKRRHAYNLMQEQMGNIRVYCRCRHVADGESILEFIGNETITLSISPNERFEFDKVFHPGMSQFDLYEEFRPLVMSFIDGYNVCFITYGGEASGKTFTLIGGNDGTNQHGIMQRALTNILSEERIRQRDWEYKITACVVEIYNDNCVDVLSDETNIQLYVDNGLETAYQKLKSVPITNEADAEALMQVCRVKRKVAKTALNPTSSRSHLITLIRLQGRSKIHGENICSFLCLCDLAGFEDIIKAETQTNKILSKEAGYINRSLTAFNRVFVSLRKQDPNTVSYRDTKLTHLLKPFLTNSGKCALVITVRNDKRSMGSTQNTLRFGRETRGVSLGKARRQVNLSGHMSVI